MRDPFTKLLEKLGKKYPGRYVAVVDGEVVASGKKQLQVYRKAEKEALPSKEIGIFYIPTHHAPQFLLKVR